jgi:hypothetical protein
VRVKIEYTVEVSDRFRRAINYRYGEPGLATRDQVKDHFRLFGTALDDDILYELQVAEEEGMETQCAR